MLPPAAAKPQLHPLKVKTQRKKRAAGQRLRSSAGMLREVGPRTHSLPVELSFLAVYSLNGHVVGIAVSFDINKDGYMVASLTLVKSAYRLGETVSGMIVVNNGQGRVLRVGLLFSITWASSLFRLVPSCGMC